MKKVLLGAVAVTCTGAVALALAEPAPDPAGKTPDPRPSLGAPASTAKARRATAIKVEVFEGEARAATITLPLWLVRGASRLLPKQMDGVDIDQLFALVDNPPENGILLEVNDQKAGERVVISIVGN
jgi:hypothetical protein